MYSLLIVDDEPEILKGIQYTLPWEKYGFSKIGTANNIQDGFTYAVANLPHLCVIDVCVGEEKGYQLINRLNDIGIKTNFIMMSGYSDFQYAVEAIRAGAKDYLLKPIEAKKLQNVVEKIIINDLGGAACDGDTAEEKMDPIINMPYSTLSPLVVKMLKLTQIEYRNKITLRSLAKQFRMNSTYLGQLFLKETHIKYTDYIMCFRLQKAKMLIENTNDKIAMIAEKIGYVNINYFYNHFHNYFGISPTEMRTKKNIQNT